MRALTLAGSVLVACVAAGCSETTEQKAREAGQQTAEAARAAGEAVGAAAQDAVNNAERASDAAVSATQEVRPGEDARNAVNNAADVAAAAVQTTQVKGALVADSSVDASGINVDTDARTKTIILKGHVPSAAQKTAAEGIAKAKASTGYTVRNELVVR